MKKILKIFIILFVGLSIFFIFNQSFAENIKGLSNINTSETIKSGVKGDLGETVKYVGFKTINMVRTAFFGIFVIFIVYAGGQMIMSKGSDEDQLSKSKRTLRYSIIAIVLLNFPLSIYSAIVENVPNEENVLINMDKFIKIISQITTSIEILIGGIATFMLVLVGLNTILSRGREEKITEAKNRVLWIIIALIFVGFIEAWESFILGGENANFDIGEGVSLFKTVMNLALYFTGPIALFFLVLAGYYYITSNGDEDKTKKGKSIVVNTVIGVVILLCSYVLLNDITSLTF